MTVWNEKIKYFRQVPGESIVDYGFHFDVEIVEAHPLLEPMSDLLKMRIYYIGL